MTTYATFTVTFKVHDRELLMSKFRETELYQHIKEQEGREDDEMLSSSAILELLIGLNFEGQAAIGVEELASTSDPDTDDENQIATSIHYGDVTYTKAV